MAASGFTADIAPDPGGGTWYQTCPSIMRLPEEGTRFMRAMSVCLSSAATLVAVLAWPSAAVAQERASIEGFGGLALNALHSASSTPPSLGGTVTVSIVPALQIVGEAGYLGNTLPTLSGAALSLAGVRASALYGEAGARLVMVPASAFTPYAEATAGVARLDIHSNRFGPLADAAIPIALELAGRTAPMLGVGGGILVRGGPVLFDVGYRYKELFPNDLVRFALGFGQALRTHQARVGVGVRF